MGVDYLPIVSGYGVYFRGLVLAKRSRAYAAEA